MVNYSQFYVYKKTIRHIRSKLFLAMSLFSFVNSVLGLWEGRRLFMFDHFLELGLSLVCYTLFSLFCLLSTDSSFSCATRMSEKRLVMSD